MVADDDVTIGKTVEGDLGGKPPEFYKFECLKPSIDL